MSILFDEHISPRLVTALSQNARLPDSLSMKSIYKTEFISTEDETWLESYAAEGGRYFVSADRRMLQRPTLLRILVDNGLVGFFFNSHFAEMPRLMQLAYVAFWWSRIQQDFDSYPSGSAWIAPNNSNFSDTPLRAHNIQKVIEAKTRSA